MRPPAARTSSKFPSVRVIPDLVIVSRELTIDLSTFDSFVLSLGPWVQALIEIHGAYTYIPEQDQWDILAEVLESLWGRRQELKGGKPGHIIVSAIVRNIFYYFEKKGRADEWERMRLEMSRAILLQS